MMIENRSIELLYVFRSQLHSQVHSHVYLPATSRNIGQLGPFPYSSDPLAIYIEQYWDRKHSNRNEAQ